MPLLLLAACQDRTEGEGSIVAPTRGITDFRQALGALHQACVEGKTVDVILPLFGNSSGWEIKFTDNTSISIIHSLDMVDDKMAREPSLYFYLDADSVWRQRTFEATQVSRVIPVGLTDGKGCPEARYAGSRQNGLYRLRTVFNVLHSTCSYSFYHYSDTTTAAKTIAKNYGQTLPFVTCIVENEQTRTVTLTMVDGEEICLAKHYDTVEEIALGEKIPVDINIGDTLVIPLNVSPANAVFSHDVSTDSSEVRLYQITADGRMIPSTLFKLQFIQYSNTTGQCEAVIIPKSNAVNSTEKLALSPFTSHPSPLTVTLHPKGTIGRPKSGLPVIFIDTPNQQVIQSKEVWIEEADITIYQPDGNIDHQGSTSIRGRGNSTFGFPKMPYALKLDKAASMLGMPADKRWALLANWIDRTLLRNDVAFAIARATGMDWVPQGRFVDLVVNHRYVGNYYLCEQVRASKNRLNLGNDDFLLEIDTYFDEPNRFLSLNRQMPYMIKSPDPDKLTPRQFNIIQQFIDSLESSLYIYDRYELRHYRALIDFRSFAQFWIVQELAANHESADPKSVYLYKLANEKLKMTVWDFDYATFMKLDSLVLTRGIYYDRLFGDQEFVRCVKQVWNESRQALLDVMQSYIDRQAAYISISEEANHRLWPITGDDKPAGDENLPFEEAVRLLKQNALHRFSLLDNKLSH